MDARTFALLFAILHVMVRERPELREEIMRVANDYQSTYFIPGAAIYDAMAAAIREVEGT